MDCPRVRVNRHEGQKGQGMFYFVDMSIHKRDWSKLAQMKSERSERVPGSATIGGMDKKILTGCGEDSTKVSLYKSV